MKLLPRAALPRSALSALLMAAALTTASLGAAAAPGAHGPNGEHLDGPASTTAASALPRVDAKSETFELVAELRPGELAILVDRYETNEPVLAATLEVETGSLKAVAAFRAEQGDYAVTDAAFLKALAGPGEHALVFTLIAGAHSDLLDATLVAAPSSPSGGNDHGHGNDGRLGQGLERAAWIGGGMAALGLLGGLAWWRRRRRDGAALVGGV